MRTAPLIFCALIALAAPACSKDAGAPREVRRCLKHSLEAHMTCTTVCGDIPPNRVAACIDDCTTLTDRLDLYCREIPAPAR